MANGQISFRELNNTSSEIGMIDFGTDITNKLDTFSSDIVDYLYEIEPQSQNLFWAGYFQETGNESGGLRIFYNACYRIRNITLPMPGLDFDISKEYRIPIFKGINYSQELQIEWYEDVYHSVQKYHLDWMNRWYNRYYDVLRTGVKGKFRKLFVVAFHYINSPKDYDSPIEVPIVEPILAFHIGGLVPKKIPDMKFDYGSDQNESPLSMTYNCGQILWGYNKGLLGGKENNLMTPENFTEENDSTSTGVPGYSAWNITNITPDIGNSENGENLERLRIARSIFNLQPGEGAIG